MKDTNRTLSFIISVTVPAVATIYQVRDYIKTAIEQWGGGYHISDPLFSGRVKRVKVKRESSSGKREPEGAEPIELTALIKRLQVVEFQIRQAGNMPDDMPIKVPVKVCEGFGSYRHGITHVTAKPGNAVLLHLTREY